MKFLSLTAALLLSGCTTATATSAALAAPLDGEAVSRLFLNGYHTYLAPVRSDDVVTDHSRAELFRPNGTYWRGMGRTGREGWYTIERDRLCVSGEGIQKQCRKVVAQGGKTYLLIDVTDNFQTLMDLWQVK